MIFGTCKLHTTRSGVKQILSKFCLRPNKHLTREMAAFAALHTNRRRLRPMNPSTGNPTSIFLMSRSKLCLHQALLRNSFRKRRELQFFCTRNAFMTILSSRVISPISPSQITMHKCVFIQQCYFYKNKYIINNNYIIINSKANKYQQNYKQTILP